MIRLLIVDDEELNLRIIQEALEESGYFLEMARSGEEAISILSSKENTFSAIILDRLMPGIDGIEVLKIIKKNPSIQDVPIILQTALGNIEDVVEGLNSGAFYYLTKPYSIKVLVSIINLAVENYSRFLRAKQELDKNRSIANFFLEGVFRVKTFTDVMEISPLLSNAFPIPRKALKGIIELLNNAIEHGNLEIGFHDKNKLLLENNYNYYLTNLISQPYYNSREVIIKIIKSDKSTIMIIKDEGNGFDHKNLLCNTNLANNLYLTNGRGILIARSGSFDKLEYLGNGNTVQVESYWNNE